MVHDEHPLRISRFIRQKRFSRSAALIQHDRPVCPCGFQLGSLVLRMNIGAFGKVMYLDQVWWVFEMYESFIE